MTDKPTAPKPEAPAAPKPPTPAEAEAVLQAHYERERQEVREEVAALLKMRGYVIRAEPTLSGGKIGAVADVVKI